MFYKNNFFSGQKKVLGVITVIPCYKQDDYQLEVIRIKSIELKLFENKAGKLQASEL